jgi:hypothetical protein
MRLPIRSSGPVDAAWIDRFLTARWNATTIVLHGEVIDAAKLPALIAVAEDRQGLIGDRCRRNKQAREVRIGQHREV